MIVVTGIAIAAPFLNKATALSHLQTIKAERATAISQSMDSITYTSDAECILDWDTEQPKCYVTVQYNYTYDGNENSDEVTVRLSDGDNKTVIDATVRAYVQQEIELRYPKETVKYNMQNMTDRNIKIKKEIAKI